LTTNIPTVRPARNVTGALDAYVGREGDLIYRRSDKTLRVHDGTTPGGIAVPALLRDLPGKPISEFSAALDRTGQQNAAALINDCIIAYTAAGNPVSIGPGNYLLAGTLIARTGMTLECSAGARFVGNLGLPAVVSHPSGTDAADPTTWPRDITIRGGVWSRPGELIEDAHGTALLTATPFFTGQTFRLTGRNILLDRIAINGYIGRGMALAGRDIRVMLPRLRHPQRRRETGVVGTASGGIRITSGFNIWVYGADVHCGDDGLQTVTGRLTGLETRNCGFIGGYVRSDGNAGLAVKLVDGLPGQVTADILFQGITAYGDGKVVAIEVTSDGFVDNLVFDSCSLFDLQNEIPVHGVGRVIQISGKTGGLDARGVGVVQFTNTKVGSNLNGAMGLFGAIQSVNVDGFDFDPPDRVAASVDARGVAALTMENGRVGCGAVNAVSLGGRTRALTIGHYDPDTDTVVSTVYETPGEVGRVTLKEVTVDGIPDGQRAVTATNIAGGLIDGLRVVSANPGGSANGVLLGRNSSNVEVRLIDVRETAGQPVVDQGRANVIGRIFGDGAAPGSVEVVGRRRTSPNVVFTRTQNLASARSWSYSSAGAITLVGQNSLRWSPSRSLLLGGAVGNLNANPLGAGGVAGTIGTAPAAWPTGWSGTVAADMTVEFLGYENFDALPLPVFRFTSATSAASTLINFSSSITTSGVQPRAVTVYAALLDGDPSQFSDLRTTLVAAGGGNQTTQMIAGITDELEPFTSARMTTSPTTAITPRLTLQGVPTAPIDVTLALACFVEAALWHATPIVPALGTSNAVDRGRDVLTHPLTTAGANAGHVSGSFLLPRLPVGHDAGVFVLDNATDGNRISLFVPDGGSNLRLVSVNGGSVEWTHNHGDVVLNQAIKFAFSYNRTAGTALFGASILPDEVEVIAGTMPSSGFTQIGANRVLDSGAGELNGQLIGLRIGDGELTAAQIRDLIR